MRSFTSSSKANSANIPIAILLLLLVLFLSALEIGARLVIQRFSQMQRRTRTERTASLALRPSPVAGPRTLLLAGNSLLSAGVEVGALQSQVASQWRVQRFVVEDTSYLDWYFGLQRLLAGGARPDAVVIMLSTRQFASNRTRGDYFAYTLMRPVDLPAVVHATNIHPTVGFGYLLAHYSAYYGMRTELRKQTSLLIFPNLQNLLQLFVPPVAGDTPLGVEGLELIRRRAAEIAKLSRDSSIPIIICVPPIGRSASAPSSEKSLLEALALEGVPALLPLPSAATAASLYSDGIHLNLEGRGLFTLRLASMLRSLRPVAPRGPIRAARAPYSPRVPGSPRRRRSPSA